MSGAYFTRSGDDWFVPTEHSRGPWHPDLCHAGPVMALVVRAVENLVHDQQLARVTAEILRPIPMAGFSVRASLLHRGRSVSRTAAEVFDDDHVYIRAYAAHIRKGDLGDVPTADIDAPEFSASAEGPFGLGQIPHGQLWFGTSVECRYAPGSEPSAGGPTTMWMRTKVPILPDEEPSPFQKLSPLADCANGVSSNAQLATFSFVNVDLSLSVLREPVGDWFASQATSFWQPNGIGQTDARLFDTQGVVGLASQSVILDRVQRPASE